MTWSYMSPVVPEKSQRISFCQGLRGIPRRGWIMDKQKRKGEVALTAGCPSESPTAEQLTGPTLASGWLAIYGAPPIGRQ